MKALTAWKWVGAASLVVLAGYGVVRHGRRAAPPPPPPVAAVVAAPAAPVSVPPPAPTIAPRPVVPAAAPSLAVPPATAPVAAPAAGDADAFSRLKRLKELGQKPGNDDFRAAMPAALKEMADIRRMLDVLAQWVTVDGAAGAAWIMQLPEVPWPECRAKNDALHRFVADWTRLDAAAVEQWLGTLPACRSRDVAISRYVQELVKGGKAPAEPQRLAAWCEKIADENFQSGAIIALEKEWRKTDPQAAAAWVAALPHNTARDLALNQLARDFAPTNPPTALLWACRIDDEGQRVNAVGHAVQAWARSTNLASVAPLLKQMPDDKTRDEALRVFAGELSKTDPPLAMQWAETISDNAQRQVAMVTVASSWVAKDRGTALRWIEQSPLPPEARQKVLGGNPQ
jgi:hypothetical protein